MQTEEQLIADIKNLKIQGATNVALSVLTYLSDTIVTNPAIDIAAIKESGRKLAYARPTEPLAQNALRFVFADNPTDAASLNARISSFTALIGGTKQSIGRYGTSILKDGNTYLTHCHASTVTNVFLNAHKAGITVQVITTETRPLMQGRITARELIDGGIEDVTMIIDDAAAAMLADAKHHIAGVLIGADMLSEHGFANKIGSLSIVLAARLQHIPVYCFSTLLKYDPRPFTPDLIETRDPEEIWPEAPSRLNIYAPAFDFTPYGSGVTVVSEAGMLQGDEVKATALNKYPFIRE